MSYHNSEDYTKSPLTFEQQIDLLTERGLIVSNRGFAKSILTSINYYRLSGYTLHLRANDKFFPNVTIEAVSKIYQFDQKLRYLLLEMIEEIEIALRVRIANYLALNFGPFSYLDSSLFDNYGYHVQFIQEFDAQINKRKADQ